MTQAFKGNQYTKSGDTDNQHHQKLRTVDKVAKEHNVAADTVQRAEHFLDGLNEAEKVSPAKRIPPILMKCLSVSYLTCTLTCTSQKNSPISPHKFCFLGLLRNAKNPQTP